MKTIDNVSSKVQLEISFTRDALSVVPIDIPKRRRPRARWWFRRMHEVVNQALDWHPVPAPRPEQIHLGLS